MTLTLDLTPDQEKLLLTIAAKIRGAYGGRKKAQNRLKTTKNNGKRSVVAQAV